MLSNDRPYLVVAGPGAGKTTDLVDVFIEEISTAPAHKFVAVITYTNASADDITAALQTRVALGKNVFVGTIHSFINQFIVLPFAHHAGKTPMDISFITEIPGLDRRNRVTHYAKLDALARKGLITHDQGIRLARGILESESSIADHIAGKLHAVLVDEYQDVTVPQEAIFEQLIKTKRSRFYFVGDPEQFVYKFMPDSPRKQATLPIVKRSAQSGSKVQVHRKTENHRSTHNIVEFLNKIGVHNQESQNPQHDQSKVLFFTSTDLDETYAAFRQKQEQLGLLNSKTFILGENFRTSDAVCLAQIEHITASSNERVKVLADSESFVCSVLQKSKSQILEELEIDRLTFRRKALGVLKLVITEGLESKDAVAQYIADTFEVARPDVDSNWQNVNAMFENLVESTSKQRDRGVEGTYKSSIRKSKGLEAECVLVVACTENELTKWLETDQKARASDASDQSQMGFVAFSRARKLLTIACAKPISQVALTKLAELDIEIITSSQT